MRFTFPPAYSRRIRTTVSKANIPISPHELPRGCVSYRNEGSLLDADHPSNGVLFARRSTTLGQGQDRYDLLQKLIARQPALRLGLLLEDLAEALLIVGVADLRTRAGALLVLEWIDDNFGVPLLPPSILDLCRPKLRALRRRRFGWVVPPQSGSKDHGASKEGDGPMEYHRVWLSEPQLELYCADADLQSIFQ